MTLRRRKIPRHVLWPRTQQDAAASFDHMKDAPSVEQGGNRHMLMTEVEAARIRDLATQPTVFWLDPLQTSMSIDMPSNDYVEYRVEARRDPGKQELDEHGRPTGFMDRQEETIQILVAREVRHGKVVREWEHDFEQVPLWHFIDQACYGESSWTSKFADHIHTAHGS